MRNVLAALFALTLVGCRSDVLQLLDEVPPVQPDLSGIDGPVPPDGFIVPPDEFIPPPDVPLPPPVDGFIPPVDGFIPLPDGIIVFDLSRDGFIPLPDLARDGFIPPVDLARDGFIPPVDLARDGFIPPPDLARDGFIPPADLAPNDMRLDMVLGNPDLGLACRSGHYAGPLTGAISGFPLTGIFDFTLGPPVGGIFPVIAGTMVGTGPLNSTFNATLAGSLDCGTRLLVGTIINGIVVVQGQRFAYTGTWNAGYDSLSNRFVNGTWIVNVPQSPLGPLIGNGTWQSN